ncbi:MAG: MIP family channel protein [Chloroflexota bacterium]|nr:MIP family channel protein [Chloroflexota bacterium]
MNGSLTRRAIAECIGTFGLVFIAAGAAMVDETSGGGLGIIGNALASGLVVTAMVYATGHISGAHINPAVTLGFALVRRISLRDAGVYWVAQMVGAILAAVVLRLLLGKVGIMGGHAITIEPAQAVGVEIALTFLLMFVIMAVATDKRAVGQAAALAIGATVTFDILVGGPLSGGSMNPARTTGPAILAANWEDLWIYWVGPPVGAALAAFLYTWLNDSKEDVDNES